MPLTHWLEIVASPAASVVVQGLIHYGLKETDLIPGLKMGGPELTGDALFKGNTRSLSW